MSKCDFRFTVIDKGRPDEFLKFVGNLSHNEYYWNNVANNAKMNVQSSKCDWNITAKTNQVQGTLNYTPEFADLSGRFSSFTGRMSSDKCDFSIVSSNAAAKIRVNSDKCDWNISARTKFALAQTAISPESLEMRTKLGNLSSIVSSDKCDFQISAKQPSGRARVSSSKCDWNVSLSEQLSNANTQLTADSFQFRGNTQNVSAFVSSSKCDWNVVSRDKFTTVNAVTSPKSFDVKTTLPAFKSRVSSSKCDFQIASMNNTRLTSNVNSQTEGTQMKVASSKCDWKLNSVGGDPTLTQRPHFNANLASSKCDFVFNIEISLTGGKPLRLKAVSSSKCDFKIVKDITTGRA